MPRESIQRKLERVRPPRVHITYSVEAAGAIERREVPFVIGVMGNYSGSGDRPPFQTRTFRAIGFDNFNEIMAELSPRVSFKISSSAMPGEIDIDLTFQAIEHFEPESLMDRVPLLNSLKKSSEPLAAQTLTLHLDQILHAPAFQRLEAAWRGLWYFVSRTESSSQLIIKLLDVTERELVRDLQRALEPDQSWFFKKVYEEPYEKLTASPFGLLVGDFDFGPTPEDVELLDKLGVIAGECHAPFITGAAPQILGLKSFREMSNARDLLRAFDSEQYVRWEAFRKSENARYVALTLPRVLLRSPYGMRPEVPGEYQHVEKIRTPEDLLWGNAAFAFATCVANAFTRYGWCGAIRGIEGGGLVEGLPTWVAREEEKQELRSGTEVIITDRHEKELTDLGFLPLVQSQHTDLAVFFTASSCCKPKLYDNDAASTNSRLMCQLSYVLTGSRFMHYIKVMAREQVGSYQTRGEWERYLNKWIQSYVISDDQVSPAIRARYPLREARIDVAEDPCKPGVYRVIAFLRPYFQLEELSVSLRIVGRIP